jgi:hypothetical protein
MFCVDVEKNYIKLIPVEVKPRYTHEELKTIDRIAAKERSRARTVRPGKEFSNYIKGIAK